MKNADLFHEKRGRLKNCHPGVFLKRKDGKARYLYEPLGVTVARSALECARETGDEQAIRWAKCWLMMAEDWAKKEPAVAGAVADVC